MSVWNLNTLRMYGNDLWSTLSLSTKKTRTMQYLLSIKSQLRYKRRRLEKRKTQTKNTKLMIARLKIVNKNRRYPRLHSKRLVITSLDRKVRRAFRLKGKRAFKRKSTGKRYLVSYVKARRRKSIFVRVKKRRFLSQNLINFRKFKRFYSTLTNRQFLVLMRQARLKKENNFEFLIKTLESRLDVLLFRSNLVTSLFMARHFLNHRHIQINAKQAYADSCIKLYDNISFKWRVLRMHRTIVQRNILMHYRVSLSRSKRIILLFLPSYLEVDFKALSFNLIAGILNKNVYYPFLVDRASIENFLFRV